MPLSGRGEKEETGGAHEGDRVSPARPTSVIPCLPVVCERNAGHATSAGARGGAFCILSSFARRSCYETDTEQDGNRTESTPDACPVKRARSSASPGSCLPLSCLCVSTHTVTPTEACSRGKRNAPAHKNVNPFRPLSSSDRASRRARARARRGSAATPFPSSPSLQAGAPLAPRPRGC